MSFEFNEVSQRQFDWLLTRYPTRQACLLPGFRLVEEQIGGVTQEAMEYLAQKLELAPAYVLGVFTFYTHYKRDHEGAYVIQLCATLSCALCKGREIEEAFKRETGLEIGQTDREKRFTLKKVECLGSCTTAPVAQINENYFEHLTPEKVKEIVAALKADRTPPHISNGPALEGGSKGYTPMVEACVQQEQGGARA